MKCECKTILSEELNRTAEAPKCCNKYVKFNIDRTVLLRQYLSRVLEYKVEKSMDPLNNWIRYIKEKEKQDDKGQDKVSKEIKGKGEVNLVQKCTGNRKCEISCKVHLQVRHIAQCTVRKAGVCGVMQEPVKDFHPVAILRAGQTELSDKSG